MGILSTIYRNTYARILPSYEGEIERHFSGYESILDVGCGSASPLRHFRRRPARKLVGIDGFQPSIDRSKAAGIHDEYILHDILRMSEIIPDKSYDAVCALDLIEHVEKDVGIRLLADLERIARKRVLIVTPKGFLPQAEFDGNAYQKHVSGWEPEEMRSLGYEVVGIRGWKPLRGEYAHFTIKPSPLGRILSDLSQFWVRSRPEKAFQILCTKDLG